MFGKCKVCKEKDSRISELKEQIAHLRSMVFAASNPFNEPIVNREANAVLGGDIAPLTFPQAQDVDDQKAREEYEAEIAERDKILSGNYS